MCLMFDIPKEDLMDRNLAQLRELSYKLKTNLQLPNHGGCCVIAVEIAKHLRTVYPTKIRVSTDLTGYDELADTDISEVADNMCDHADCDEWNDNGIYFGHVVVEFKYRGRNYHMDTNGVKRAKDVDPSFGWIFYPGEFPLKPAQTLANNTDHTWNSMFNRKQIPSLRKMVSTFFKAAQLS